jgi:hypothetical protein
MEPFDQDLRDAFRRIELPAAPARLRAEVESLRAATRSRAGNAARLRWPRRSALVTLVAAVAVIALVAVALPVLRGQPQTGPASPSASHPAPSATPIPSLSPVPVPTASEASLIPADGPSITWTTVPLSQFGSNTVFAVGAAQVGGTMVVAANDSPPQNDMKPVIIESTNGADWTLVPTDGAQFAHARLDYLLTVPGGLLLVGESQLPDPLCPAAAAGCNQAPAVTLMWRSSDGQTWQPLSAKAMAPFDRVWIVSIAAGPKGLVSFGLLDPVMGNPQNMVFHSLDGQNWSSAAFPDQSGGATGVLVQSVAATSTGFVAVGGDAAGAAWYSADGLTWKRASTPSGSSCGPATNAAAGSDGVVANCMGLWVSADGRTWLDTTANSPFSYGQSWIAGDGTQILVITGQSVYWSKDGETWHRGDSTPAMSGASVGGANLAWILGSTVIAAGSDDQTLYVGSIAGH